MALFRKFFYRKPPDGLLEITERVYVFDSCFTTDVFNDDKYQDYIGDIVAQLQCHFADASFMVFNFREGESQSLLANILSSYEMVVMDYPRQYEGCPLVTIEMIHHFLRSGESWLSLSQQNVLIMHCERGGWAVLAFMLAGLLLYRKQYIGEQRTLEMIYRQAPRELIQLLSPLNPMPSQIRYLHYISRRNVSAVWPPGDRALTLDCVILRNIPGFNGEGGCRPIFRIYGKDPLLATSNTPKVLFSTPKRSKYVRLYKKVDCELIKIDIHCHIQGDVVLECISLDADQQREEMIFRVMFNTAFIRSNILMLNRDEIDILWDAKDRFPKEFRAEVLFSEMDSVNQLDSMEVGGIGEKEGLPVEAFAKVQEMFSNVDWLDPTADAAALLFQQLTSSENIQLRKGLLSPNKKDFHLSSISPTKKQSDNVEDKLSNAELSTIYVHKQENNDVQGLIPQKQATIPDEKSGSSVIHEKMISLVHEEITQVVDINTGCLSSLDMTVPSTMNSSRPVLIDQNSKLDDQLGSLQSSSPTMIMSQQFPVSRSSSVLSSDFSPRLLSACPRFHSAPSALGITALLEDHAAFGDTKNSVKVSSAVVKIPSKQSSQQHPITVTPVVTKCTPSPPPLLPPLAPVVPVPSDDQMISQEKDMSQQAQKHPVLSLWQTFHHFHPYLLLNKNNPHQNYVKLFCPQIINCPQVTLRKSHYKFLLLPLHLHCLLHQLPVLVVVIVSLQIPCFPPQQLCSDLQHRRHHHFNLHPLLDALLLELLHHLHLLLPLLHRLLECQGLLPHLLHLHQTRVPVDLHHLHLHLHHLLQLHLLPDLPHHHRVNYILQLHLLHDQFHHLHQHYLQLDLQRQHHLYCLELLLHHPHHHHHPPVVHQINCLLRHRLLQASQRTMAVLRLRQHLLVVMLNCLV
uniref:C2 tensin-type domain-containing protein n=1 Tax=Oryza rufipogon TaxID=4529 RepID=A0A0E0QGR4_ORYRU